MTDPGRRAQLQPVAANAHEDRTRQLSALYRAHGDTVWRQARRLGFDAAQSEDLVHDVFLVLRDKLDELDPAVSPRPYLLAITRRVAANKRRATARATQRERAAPTPLPAPSPEQASARRQAATLVAHFLEQLDPDQRTVFELAEIEGLSGPEIADLLGNNLNTVYSRLRLARTKFRAFAASLTQPFSKGRTA